MMYVSANEKAVSLNLHRYNLDHSLEHLSKLSSESREFARKVDRNTRRLLYLDQLSQFVVSSQVRERRALFVVGWFASPSPRPAAIKPILFLLLSFFCLVGWWWKHVSSLLYNSALLSSLFRRRAPQAIPIAVGLVFGSTLSNNVDSFVKAFVSPLLAALGGARLPPPPPLAPLFLFVQVIVFAIQNNSPGFPAKLLSLILHLFTAITATVSSQARRTSTP
jgi:hypothetical protein